MKCSRICRAWLPSVIFPLNYGYVVEREKTIVNGLRRATNHGKFLRAASFEFNIWAFGVRQLKMFQWTRKSHIRHFIVHWSITEELKFFKEMYVEFRFNRCFRERSLRNYKRSSALCFTPLRFSCFRVKFDIAQVYLRLADWREYNGHLQNEWAIKPFGKHPKSRKIVSI